MGREEGSRWGTCVYLWRIHVDIWQKQYNILKLKNKIKKKKNKALAPTNLSDFFYHSLLAHRAPTNGLPSNVSLLQDLFTTGASAQIPILSPHHFQISSIHSDPLNLTFSDTLLVLRSKVANQSLPFFQFSAFIYLVSYDVFVCEREREREIHLSSLFYSNIQQNFL